MATRLTIPALQRRVQPAEVEQRFDLGGYIGQGGFGFPSVNATGSSLILDRKLESYSGSEIAYRCVQIKTTAMAALDLAIEKQVLDEQGKPGLDLDKDDALAVLFNKRTGSSLSAVATKRIAFEQMELTGQAFLYTQRAGNDPAGEITAIAPIFGTVRPIIDDTQSTLEKCLLPQIYGYQVQTRFGVIGLLPSEVLWWRYPHPTIAWEAMPPWKAAQWAADLDRNARQWQSAEFSNGGKPTGVISLGDVTEDQARRVKAQFESQHSGTANAGKHLFLWGPTKAEYSRIGRTGVEMGYLESHAANAQDICHAFGVPIDLIIGQATYDNRHSAWVSLWTDTLTPILELVEGDMDRQLLPDSEERAVFDRTQVAALQENVDSVHARATTTWINDGCTLAEYRKAIGMEPTGTPADAMIFSQLQAEFKPAPVIMAPPGSEDPTDGSTADKEDAGNKKAKDEADQNQEDANGNRLDSDPIENRAKIRIPSEQFHRSLDRHELRISRAMARVAEKQRRTAIRKLAKLNERSASGHEIRISNSDVFDETYWEDQTREALDEPMDSAWSDGAIEMALLLGVSWEFVKPKVTAASQARLATVAQQITATTAKQLEKTLQEGLAASESSASISERVRSVFDALIPSGNADDEQTAEEAVNGWRSAMIGMTEAAAGYSSGSLIAARADGSGVTYKTWIAQANCCPLCEDLAGQTVTISDDFNGAGSPPLHNACRCEIEYTKADGTSASEENA